MFYFDLLKFLGKPNWIVLVDVVVVEIVVVFAVVNTDVVLSVDENFILCI